MLHQVAQVVLETTMLIFAFSFRMGAVNTEAHANLLTVMWAVTVASAMHRRPRAAAAAAAAAAKRQATLMTVDALSNYSKIHNRTDLWMQL
jgi:hypothetical protein